MRDEVYNIIIVSYYYWDHGQLASALVYPAASGKVAAIQRSGVPTGRDPFLTQFQAINCLATITQSLRDAIRF
jgi:hypothetical protein